RRATLMIHAAEQAQMLFTGLDEIAVVLDGKNYAEFLGIVGTFPQRVRDPRLDSGAARIARSLLSGFWVGK
ncbi:MAG: hypothetical protein WCS94_23145, partial [Verrucomicrobiota bacterium]